MVFETVSCLSDRRTLKTNEKDFCRVTQVPEFSQFQMYSIEEQVNCCAWAIAFENLAESQRRFTEKYNRAAPSRSQINFWKLKLIETGSLVKDRPRSGRPLTATGEENKQIIQEQLNENPHTSIRRLSNENDIPSTSISLCEEIGHEAVQAELLPNSF